MVLSLDHGFFDAPCLRQVESPLPLLDGNIQPVSQDFDVGVIGEFEVVDASHDTGQIVVGRVRRIARPAHDREHRGQTLETC